MRITIQDMPGAKPLVMERMSAVVLAAQDDSEDGSVPCVAQGEPEMIAALAATVLISIHHKLGEKAFEAVIRAARRGTSRAVAEDVTDSVREGR